MTAILVRLNGYPQRQLLILPPAHQLSGGNHDRCSARRCGDDRTRATATGAPAAKQASTRPRQSPVGFGGDSMVDAAATLLRIPLRELYAVLWRVGLIEVMA